ncbi:GNAT family N-acetyltransferase [Pengzhenrongella sp.]|jgi:ribosomal protein S18 acetylase RimI-like enzyme|uniref:GNAT family N-acetyltransferase n=1 Tax=Pengzhenrongella sp. TaxID=2888820 RepID=UPI002F935DA8
MTPDAVLAAFDAQIRRHPGPSGPHEVVERADGVVRILSAGWAGVTWSDLDGSTADAAIAAQVDRFAELARPWEWKHYSYDEPSDLAARLLAASLAPEPAEALMVAEIADLALDVSPPSGIELLAVTDARGVEALVRVHDDVFGGDHSELGAQVLAALSQDPPGAAAVIASFEGTAVAAGRVEFREGTDFASIWGGGTLPAWRRRGVFRSMVAHRAALAAARGFRYLQVDASPDSRPILRRLGFVELATTTPFVFPG